MFRIRGIINNKLFQLIIDNRSFENIISREAVRELKLPIEKHPHPYTIGWINMAKKIEVNERCKVPFSIGKYQNEAYYDVVDMDACQLLFGRLWQFDRDVRYSGKENMYRLKKDGVRFTLFPLTSGSHPKIKHKVGEQNKVADDLNDVLVSY